MTGMPTTATSSTATTLAVGGRWVLDVDLVDADGVPVTSTAPTVAVTLPDGTSATAPVAELVDATAGTWRATYSPTVAGRHVATVTGADDAATFAAYAIAVTTGTGMPTADDVAAYLGGSAASWTTAELDDALAVEAAAQRDVCVVGALYPDSLRGALLRRVARNLAMRRLPLAVPTGDGDGGGPTILPGTDPEVRRLERPHRRFTVA